MKLVRDFERRLEQLVDGMAGKVFRGKLHPVELAARLVREADLAVEEGPLGPTVPNVYVLRVNPRDLDTEIPAVLIQELEQVLESTAADRGWQLDGPVQVSIEAVETASIGTIDSRVDRNPGTLPAWGFLTTADGIQYPLTRNRSVVGRSETSHVTLADPGISRTHALLWREGGETWVADLDSANGTQVDGVSSGSPLPLTTGAVLTLGPVALTFGKV